MCRGCMCMCVCGCEWPTDYSTLLAAMQCNARKQSFVAVHCMSVCPAREKDGCDACRSVGWAEQGVATGWMDGWMHIWERWLVGLV